MSAPNLENYPTVNPQQNTNQPNPNYALYAVAAFVVLCIIGLIVYFATSSDSTDADADVETEIDEEEEDAGSSNDTSSESKNTQGVKTAVVNLDLPAPASTGIGAGTISASTGIGTGTISTSTRIGRVAISTSITPGTCVGSVPGAITSDCFADIWKNAGCTTPAPAGNLTWANSNKLSLDALKDDSKAWATMNDSEHILGCYVTQPAPQNIRMYGPAVGHPVGNQEIRPTGVYRKGNDLIYLLKDGPYIKMVDKSGAAKHFSGDISAFNPSSWPNYNDSTGGYFIKTI